jgi:hypothetical protein
MTNLNVEVLKLKEFKSTTMKKLVAKEITLKQYNELFQNELTRVSSELKMEVSELGFLIIS